MVVLFRSLSVDQAQSYGLALTSSGIFHEVKKGENGWELGVQEADFGKALRTIGQYVEENEEGIPSSPQPPVPLRKNWSGLWVSLGLLGLHIVFRTNFAVENIFRTYGSSALRILEGEFYRTVTSLMLHANTVHLLGNMVGIALFGTAVCSLMGVGIGWLMILAAGAAGNLLNAFFYGANHLSVGSSTAVFGAVGMLCAQQFVRKIKQKQERRIKAWIPFAGGLALLGLLGTAGERADLMAHLFGFLAGIPLGLAGAGLPERLMAGRYQFVALATSLGIMVVAWLIPPLGG